MKRVALGLFALMALHSLAAQDESFAFVIYAEGFDMSIYRNGELTTYDVVADTVIGMPLLAGDLVQTDADTFVEIQVMPSRTVIKVAENTTFEIEQIGGSGGGVFDMRYGRLRARVERLSSNDPFEIRGQGAVAGVRGTDFGYDLVVNRESITSEIETKVYCFEGEVEVKENVAEPSLDETPGETGEAVAETAGTQEESVFISANEMVNVITEVPTEMLEEADELVAEGEGEPADATAEPAPEPRPRKVSFQTRTIEDEIQEFWTEKNFKEEAVDPEAVEERFPGIKEQVRILSEERRRFEELQRMRRAGLLGSGNAFVASETVVDEPDEPERDPDEVQMAGPLPEDRVRRIVAPTGPLTMRDRARIAGHWMTGLGLVLGGAGVATAYFIDDVRSVDDVNAGGVGTGLAMSGSVMISSGLISYLISLFASDAP